MLKYVTSLLGDVAADVRNIQRHHPEWRKCRQGSQSGKEQGKREKNT